MRTVMRHMHSCAKHSIYHCKSNDSHGGCRYKEVGSETPVYQERIVEMVQANRQTLEVDFIQLSKHATALAIWAIDAPSQLFDHFSVVATEATEDKFQAYVRNVHQEIFVRMTGLPVVEPLRNIRCAASRKVCHSLFCGAETCTTAGVARPAAVSNVPRYF